MLARRGRAWPRLWIGAVSAQCLSAIGERLCVAAQHAMPNARCTEERSGAGESTGRVRKRIAEKTNGHTGNLRRICAIQHTTCTPGIQRAHLAYNVHTWHTTCTPGMQRAHLTCIVHTWHAAHKTHSWQTTHNVGTVNTQGRWADRSGTSDGEAVELAVKRRGDRRADARLAHARRPDLPCGMGYRAARIGYHGMPTAVPGR